MVLVAVVRWSLSSLVVVVEVAVVLVVAEMTWSGVRSAMSVDEESRRQGQKLERVVTIEAEVRP